eukprot:TRINITY_DN25505_c0_g2_i1.p1 TRINITY_DN25505_c0_g2~~TRINITY_DN25505_c0_g2_i1.p1  ORF type:complete len:334 (-),score=69.75 TRINITY_DN25505_c0_g2_i1:484-1485(-)
MQMQSFQAGAAGAGAAGAAAGSAFPDVLFKHTKLCKFYQAGGCTRGLACGYAHGEEELVDQPDLRKTKMCTEWSQKGSCARGSRCKFAHGMKELRSDDVQSSCADKNSTVVDDVGSVLKNAGAQRQGQDVFHGSCAVQLAPGVQPLQHQVIGFTPVAIQIPFQLCANFPHPAEAVRDDEFTTMMKQAWLLNTVEMEKLREKDHNSMAQVEASSANSTRPPSPNSSCFPFSRGTSSLSAAGHVQTPEISEDDHYSNASSHGSTTCSIVDEANHSETAPKTPTSKMSEEDTSELSSSEHWSVTVKNTFIDIDEQPAGLSRRRFSSCPPRLQNLQR